MSSKNDGGPAFPIGSDYGNATGMSLRDYFAAKALEGTLAEDSDVSSGSMNAIAVWCYEFSDAMIAARDR